MLVVFLSVLVFFTYIIYIATIYLNSTIKLFFFERTYMEQQILLLTPGIRKKLKELASQDGRSISKYIEKLIERTWRQKHGKKKAA